MLGEIAVHLFQQFQRVDAAFLGDRQQHARTPLAGYQRGGLLAFAAEPGDIFQRQLPCRIGGGKHGQAGEMVRRDFLAEHAQQPFLVTDAGASGWGVLKPVRYRIGHVGGGQAARCDGLRVEGDAQLRVGQAGGEHTVDAVHAFQIDLDPARGGA